MYVLYKNQARAGKADTETARGAQKENITMLSKLFQSMKLDQYHQIAHV